MKLLSTAVAIVFLALLPLGTNVSDVAAVMLIAMSFLVAWRRWGLAHLFGLYERRWVAIFLLAFLLFVIFSLALALSLPVAMIAAGHLFLAIAAGVSGAYLINQGLVALDFVFGTIVFGAVAQSIVGFLQFALQSSLGLQRFGESEIGPHAAGVAKIVVDGVRFIRAYGTFPHPNVLAAFLLVGVVAVAYYFFVRHGRLLNPHISDDRLRCADLFLIASQFIIFLGLLLTFSRAAWIIGVLVVFAIVWWAFRQPVLRAAAIRYAVVVSASTLILLAIFYPFIFARATFAFDEPAVADRFSYLRLGARIVAERPLGVGIGNQVLFATERGLYDALGLTQSWQREPIHNLYLLIASEVGIFGLMAFCAFLFSNFNVQISTFNKYSNFNIQFFSSALMLMALLLFGFTDHFLWDIQQGRLLLWVVIGLLVA